MPRTARSWLRPFMVKRQAPKGARLATGAASDTASTRWAATPGSYTGSASTVGVIGAGST